jgi:hypothetical protein
MRWRPANGSPPPTRRAPWRLRDAVIKSIRLTGDEQEIECRHEAIKGLVLRAEFVRKL